VPGIELAAAGGDPAVVIAAEAAQSLFKKKDAGAVIPIKIVGTPDKPSFGLEARRVLTRKEVASPASESDRFRRSIPSCADVLDTSSRDPTQVSRSSSAPLSLGRRRVEPERR
jgi:hypothetical protein